jgi:precorrin-2/cobalt-factor-2 C20-methyltransferase
MSIGILYGVGVGPGDPELMTRKAERILREVDWIFLPAPRNTGISFARQIVEPLGLPEKKFRVVPLCLAHDRTTDKEAYKQVAAEMVEEARQGRSAAWITEGDPSLYSTFGYLHEELLRYPEVRIEIIPGVSSVSAAAARARVPLARQDEQIVILPAVYCLEQLPALLAVFTTVVLLKIHSVFDRLLETLTKMNKPLRAIYAERVGTTRERIVEDLESLRGQTLPYFSLVILRREVPS